MPIAIPLKQIVSSDGSAIENVLQADAGTGSFTTDGNGRGKPVVNHALGVKPVAVGGIPFGDPSTQWGTGILSITDTQIQFSFVTGAGFTTYSFTWFAIGLKAE